MPSVTGHAVFDWWIKRALAIVCANGFLVLRNRVSSGGSAVLRIEHRIDNIIDSPMRRLLTERAYVGR